MKICRVVPILDTVGHMTNYTWIGPVVIVNLILFLKLFLVQLDGHVTTLESLINELVGINVLDGKFPKI